MIWKKNKYENSDKKNLLNVKHSVETEVYKKQFKVVKKTALAIICCFESKVNEKKNYEKNAGHKKRCALYWQTRIK